MLRLGQQEFAAGQFAVMAIVNRTPDSFYDGGANADLSRALDAAERAVEAGADIVDVGGVRAGYGPPVDAEEELRRVLPVIRGIRERFGHLVISVDTWRAPVAAEAIAAGADLVNDTWAGADSAPRRADRDGLAGARRAVPQGLRRRDARPAARRAAGRHACGHGDIGLARRARVPYARRPRDPARARHGGEHPRRPAAVGGPPRPGLRAVTPRRGRLNARRRRRRSARRSRRRR